MVLIEGVDLNLEPFFVVITLLVRNEEDFLFRNHASGCSFWMMRSGRMQPVPSRRYDLNGADFNLSASKTIDD